MVYSNRFVLSILVEGRVQKELANGTVKIPFGSEYVLRFRNKNSRRAVVKFFIDGDNVSGGGYIIPANDSVDIKRHCDKDRSFKFVSLDSEEAVDFGKNGSNEDKLKGTIEARFYLEKESPPSPTYIYRDYHHHHYPAPKPVAPEPWKWPTGIGPIWSSDGAQITCGTAHATSHNAGQHSLEGQSFSFCSNATKRSNDSDRILRTTRLRTKSAIMPESDAIVADAATSQLPELKDGCTVEGETTGQSFTTRYIDLETDFTTLRVFLQGFEPSETPAEQPVKVRKTNKDSRLDDLESENADLKEKLAQLENERLKEKIDELTKSK